MNYAWVEKVWKTAFRAGEFRLGATPRASYIGTEPKNVARGAVTVRINPRGLSNNNKHGLSTA